mgnify:CR=1 FL=1
MNRARVDIHCDQVYSMGITGRGIGVAVLDTGIFLHEDLKDRVKGFADFVRRKDRPYDDNGHGTHVAAMIGGSGASMEGKYRGVAPGCSIISVKVLDHRGNGYASDVLSGLRWIRSHKEFLGIRIVNISVGSLSKRDMTENSALVKGVNAAWDDGLVVVVAAGNHGPGPMTVTTPGISRKVITVGCSDDHKEVEVMGNRMVDYSGRVPQGAADTDRIVIPQIAADFSYNHGNCVGRKLYVQCGIKVVNGLDETYTANLKQIIHILAAVGKTFDYA